MNGEQTEPVEFLVVGGGVIGLSIAFELLQRDRQVVLVERDRPGSGATSAAGGMLAPISEAEVEPPELIRFAQESLRRFPPFVDRLERLTGLSCRYRSNGTLWVALDRDHVGELQHLEETLRTKGLDARELSADEARMLEPHLSNRVLGGLLVADDHQVDPRCLSRCLERAVRALGGQIVGGIKVEAVESHDGRVTGVSGKRDNGRPFQLAASTVVLATGAWTSEEIRLPSAPTVRPVKGQLVRLRGPSLIEHVLRTPDIYLIPRADGEILVGATMEEMGFDGTPTAGAVMDLLRHGWEVLPAIYELELTEISVGLRSAVADHLPVIGPAEVAGLFLAYGHFRNGILLAPATAFHAAEWLVGGAAPAALAPFSPARLDAQDRSQAM